MEYLPFEWRRTFIVKAIMTVQTVKCCRDSKNNQYLIPFSVHQRPCAHLPSLTFLWIKCLEDQISNQLLGKEVPSDNSCQSWVRIVWRVQPYPSLVCEPKVIGSKAEGSKTIFNFCLCTFPCSNALFARGTRIHHEANCNVLPLDSSFLHPDSLKTCLPVWIV